MDSQKRKYSIGLDIGTASVGYAVIYNDNFKIARKKSKKVWGVRLFDEAQTAQATRNFRSTRRRYNRRRERIKLLQDIFRNEINKVDNQFYQKLNESFYNEKDNVNKKIKITDQEKNLIKKFHEEYKTIYHLRSKLINDPTQKDIRLVYLAIHHIIKYRGNFLYDNDNFDVENLDIKGKLEETFENLIIVAENLGINEDNISSLNYDLIEKSLLNESKSDKQKMLKENLKVLENKNFINEYVKLMIGNKANLIKMFSLDSSDKLSISFKGSDYDDKFDEINKILQEKMEVLDLMKQVYNIVFLKSLFKGEKTTNISDLMVKKFKKHEEDLKFLKQILKENRKEYNKIFRTKGKYICEYDKYIHNKTTYKEFISVVKKCIENTLPNISDQKKIDSFFNIKLPEMNEDKFMPRITDSDNGKYPYQLNKKELISIIENQGKYYPFLLDKIGDDYKILKLLTFRIPYYVGPLNNTTNNASKSNPNSWMIRKVQGVKITPYNFEDIVDLDSSAEQFITRMVSTCTYLLNEPSMPAQSILYSKYKVYNELKQIKINDEKLYPDMINKIYKELFLTKNGNITNRVFVDYLKTLNDYSMYEDLTVTGYSSLNKFANNMQSYIDFFGNDGIFTNTNYNVDNAEEIINWITIFEDKKILERKVRQNYDNLTEEAIKKILSKRYKGWSRLSKKLLTTKYYVDKQTENKKSIMDLLVETNKNFMQIINDDKYKFDKMIEQFNLVKDTTNLNYSVVANLSTSPSIKKGIYQSLKIVKEIVKYMGYEPENIMIEMARRDENKNRTDSRKEKLLKMYIKSKSEIDNYNNLIKELKKEDEKNFNKEKLYLYFLQEGKSLYSGKPLDINYLENYEIDHILPRTLIKDDSIENKALVLKEENQEKAASFILPEQFRNNKNYLWWEKLKKNEMMTDKKINNLKRHKFSDKDINGFINRQIVETRQITKHIANILQNYYKNTKIIYLKAQLSTDFRKKFEIFKYRNLNDLHHAHDAYLAAVLGYYKEKFFKEVDYEALKKDNYEFYQTGRYKYDKKYGYLINNIDPNIVIYDKETGDVLIDNNEFIKTVENTLYNSDILVSKKTEINTGEFYNQTILKKSDKLISLKNNLPAKLYGGYSSINPSYAIVISYIKKGKKMTRMIGLPIYIDKLNNEKVKENYIKKKLGLEEDSAIEIIKDKIPFNVIIDWEGKICSLTGATDKVEVCNGKEFIIDKKHLREWKYTLNRVLNGIKTEKLSEENYNQQLSDIISYILDKIEHEYKLYNDSLEEMKSMFRVNSIKDKEIIIIQILRLLKFNSETANLKDLDEKLSKTYGRRKEKNISHGKLIYKSVTGLYEDTYEF